MEYTERVLLDVLHAVFKKGVTLKECHVLSLFVKKKKIKRLELRSASGMNRCNFSTLIKSLRDKGFIFENSGDIVLDIDSLVAPPAPTPIDITSLTLLQPW
jgi:hypothetical protein